MSGRTFMIGFGLDRFDRASTCIRDLRVSKLCSARMPFASWPDAICFRK